MTPADPDTLADPIIPAISPELLATLRDELSTCRSYHRQVLIRRTLRRLAIIDLTLRGSSRDRIVAALRCGRSTVTKWRRRYTEDGIDAILARLAVRRPGPRH